MDDEKNSINSACQYLADMNIANFSQICATVLLNGKILHKPFGTDCGDISSDIAEKLHAEITDLNKSDCGVISIRTCESDEAVKIFGSEYKKLIAFYSKNEISADVIFTENGYLTVYDSDLITAAEKLVKIADITENLRRMHELNKSRKQDNDIISDYFGR